MQILTSTPSSALRTDAQPQLEPARPAMRRPAAERWTVNGDTFTKTSDLVSRANDLDGAAASYIFSKDLPLTRTERVLNVVGGTVLGTLAGGTAGYLLGGAVDTLNGVTSSMLSFIGEASTAAGTGSALTAQAVGAAIGAAIGLVGMIKSNLRPVQGQISGELRKNGDSLMFYPQGESSQEVNLSEYQHAQTGPAKSKPKAETVALNTLKGAAWGVAASLPLVSSVGPTMLGFRVGGLMDKQRTAFGTGVGTLLGMASTAAIVAATSHAAPSTYLYVLGAFGLAGAALGHKAYTAHAETETSHRELANQWWSKTNTSPAAAATSSP